MQPTTASQHLFPRWPRAGRLVARIGASLLLVALAACGGADEKGADNETGPVAPSITAQPLSVVVNAGETATFAVQAGGTAPLTYRWQRSTNAVPGWTDISGATQASLALPAVASGDSGSQVRVVVSNAAGSATSSAATLTVLPAANAFYVSLGGSNSNPGTQARPWRTIAYAVSSASAAPAGATIYVQAGSYGNENVTVQKDGISLIGYRTTPGDQPVILANSQTPFAAFDPAEQPLLDGGNRANGIAINLRGRKNVTLRNISITRYKYGVLSGNSSQTFVENHLLFNVNLSTLGDVNASYSGLGMSLGMMGSWYANGVTVRNSLIVNAAAEGLTVNGNGNLVDNVKVYCNDVSTSAAATDYYIMVSGNDNIVENSLVSRQPGLAHNGHGFSIKSNAEMVVDGGGNYPVVNPERNLFRNNVAYNLGEGFVVRHRGVRFNVFRDNKVYGPSGDRDCEGNGIVIRDGASDNEFYDTTVENACSAVRFNDTVEDGDSMSNPPGHPGNHNIVDGVKGKNLYYAVNFNDYSIQSDAGANVIRNSEFVNIHLLFNVNRHATRMSYANNRFAGRAVSDPGDNGGFRGGSYPGDVVPAQFANCRYENIKGGVPSGF